MIADSADIKFACLQCGQRIVVDKSAAGLSGTCPICEGPVTVPRLNSISEHPSDGEIETHDHRRGPFADPGLEATREELFATSVELGQLQRELDGAKSEIERQRSLFKKAVEECERITASATHAQAEIKSFQADRQQLKGDLSQVKQRALTAETQVAELAVSLGAAQEASTALQQRMDEDAALSQARLAATETQLDVRERELVALREESSTILQSLAGAQAELAASGFEVKGLRGQLGVSDALLQESARTQERLLHAKEELQAGFDKAAIKAQRVRQERDELNERVEVLQRDLVETDGGRELLDLRNRLDDLMADRAQIADTLAEKRTEVKVLTVTEQTLRAELEEMGRLREEAERRATENSELQLNKDNEVLRGIVARQNTTMGVYFSEVRRLRRERFGLRLVYWLFGLAFLVLVGWVLIIFTYHQAAGLF